MKMLHTIDPAAIDDPISRRFWEAARANFFELFRLANVVAPGNNPPALPPASGTLSHHSLADLTSGDDHTQYLLLAGRSGGQIAYGGSDYSGYTLTLFGDHAETCGLKLGGAVVEAGISPGGYFAVGLQYPGHFSLSEYGIVAVRGGSVWQTTFSGSIIGRTADTGLTIYGSNNNSHWPPDSSLNLIGSSDGTSGYNGEVTIRPANTYAGGWLLVHPEEHNHRCNGFFDFANFDPATFATTNTVVVDPSRAVGPSLYLYTADNASHPGRSVIQVQQQAGDTGSIFKVFDSTTTKLLEINANGNFVDDTFRVVDNADPSKKVALECSGISASTTRTLTVPNTSGTIALTSDLSSGYQPLDSDLTTIAGLTVARGDIMVGNSSPAWSNLAKGTANQVLCMDGSGNDPTWTTAGATQLANRTRTIWIPADQWFDAGTGVHSTTGIVTSGTYPAAYWYYPMSGSANTQLYTYIQLPQDFISSTTTWKVYYANNGTSTNGIIYNLYCKTVAALSLVTAANDWSQTAIALTPSGTKDNLNIQTLSTTNTSMVNGGLCRISFDRQPGHASDTNAGQMNFIGISLDYTADM